ncbi:aldehyde dehydrogenase family protein [Natronorubrum sp. FCH18a]|uniref:aldehyde dehydrogenase family protein n=1 Tax=Natronorubrum sp. FCH18a TaxID=3447018 RepID=UPI003F50F0BB
MDSEFELVINGKTTGASSGETFQTDNPATKEQLATVSRGAKEDVDTAVQSAREAFESEWRETSNAERAAILREIATNFRDNADRLAKLDCLDQGKPLSNSQHSVNQAARYFEYYASAIDVTREDSIPVGSGYTDFTRREPYGIVGEIVPWNYPVQLFARSLAPALAVGNTVVVKPAELTPLTAIEMGRLIAESSIPDGAVNIVPGFGDEAGAAVSAHPDIDKVGFTGSVRTGQKVMESATQNLTPVTLELGGKNPYLMFPDADFDEMADDLVIACLSNAGQTCSAASRLLIHEAIHEDFIPVLVERFEELTVGSGVDDPDIGSLIGSDHFEKVRNYIEIGKQEANLVTGGRSTESLPDVSEGYFIEPTVFDDVSPDDRIAQEEVFGPVLSVIEFSDEEEAIEIANDVEYGLTSGVATKDIDRANRIARELRSGQVYVNEWYAGGIKAPFGGVKNSGFGRVKGTEALDQYSQVKNICFKYES